LSGRWRSTRPLTKEKIFYLISHSVEELTAAPQTEARFDQELVDFLAVRKLTYVDDLDAPRADFAL
jgi:hypothetical protein